MTSEVNIFPVSYFSNRAVQIYSIYVMFWPSACPSHHGT